MLVSTKGRYALRAVVDIAENSRVDRVSLRSVAGILASVRGKNGGYQLARPASDITAGDVIRAVEGEVASAPCSAEGEPCERASLCRTARFWMGLENVVDQYLDATNIADLAVPDLAGNDYVI